MHKARMSNLKCGIDLRFPDSRIWTNDSGYLHREDGPARIDDNGSEHWLQNGEYHRVGGPCYDGPAGEEWQIHGKHHRVDGPAIIWSNGKKTWCINDKELLNKDVYEFFKENKIDPNNMTEEDSLLFAIKFS